MLEEDKKKKVASSVTYTTGSVQKNIDHFNKMLTGKEGNFHTDGYMNGTIKAQSPDGASSLSTGGEASGGEGGGCCESLTEGTKDYSNYVGKTIKIISIGDDPAADRYEGKTGVVQRIARDCDNDVQLWGTWGGIAVYPDHDEIEIIENESLEEDTHAKYAKPEGSRELSYKNAKQYADKTGHPFCYGYTNRRLGGKFFAFDQPFRWHGDDQAFRAQYKDCGTIYVAYPDKPFAEGLNEQLIYISKWNENVEIPDHIHILPRRQIEDAISKLEPEEEFEIGYVTPIRFYTELDDKFNLVKCTTLLGYTGIDYIEARADDDANKEKRIQIAKDTAALGTDKGVHYDKRPLVNKVGDFSAQYSQTNKTVVQHADDDGVESQFGTKWVAKDEEGRNYETILFYPKVGSHPNVVYYLDTHNGRGFRKAERDQVQRIILDRVQEIANQLKHSRWTDQKLADKIQKQLDSDAATINAVAIDKEDRAETRSKISNGNIAKPQVRALYTNQVYYISTPYETLGQEITEGLQTDTGLTWFVENWDE